MDFDIDTYIDKKIQDLIHHLKAQFIESQMTQDYHVVSAITKKIQKAKQAKIHHKNRRDYSVNPETLKDIIDHDDVFDFSLKIEC